MVLELQNIEKRFGRKPVLRGVSLKIEKGCYLLLGPNGAGKSTLMNIMVGMLNPTAGRILVDGCDVSKTGDDYLERIGYGPQYPRFYPQYTVYEFLEYMSLLRNGGKSTRDSQIDEVIERVNLSGKRDSKIRTLSGGMRQRLGIAQAILGHPELVILDEPSAGLDPLEHDRFQKIVEDLSSEMIVFMATHLVSDIRDLTSRVMLLRNGVIDVNESIEEILTQGRYASVEEMYIDYFNGEEICG